MTSKTKKIVWISAAGLLIVVLAVAFWIRRFHRYTPVEVVQDIRAGIMAHHAPRPVERFLELRYGPLTEPANRQKAFLDFFNVGHIEGLHVITSRMVGAHRQTNIAAMAQWIADYRRTMSPEEKQTLAAYFRTDAGRFTLQQATAKYLSHEVRYRSDTAPVIAELMATLAAVKKP